MLSRRNIRIKIMQLLYANINGAPTQEVVLDRYNDQIQQSYKLYLFNLATTAKVSDFAQIDKQNRVAKLLPTDADVNFYPKLALNDLAVSINSSVDFSNELLKYGIDTKIEESTIKLVYNEFVKKDEYISYQENEETKAVDHKAVLLALFKHCLGNAIFEDLVDDRFTNWEDDKSLVVGAVKRTIKALPLEEKTYLQFKPNDETTKEFGYTLLKHVLEQDKRLLDIIEPNLKNWDADRVAIIDMILLKMAIAELLNFPSIPTKVTLNEYVEIAKLYSTDKSKDFINGILDRLMKKLESDGQINKKGRGLIE
jgi:N utilization substance protein B